jgi:hypothetical protein
MKKTLFIGALAALAIVLLAGAGFAYAQANELGLSDILSGTYAVSNSPLTQVRASNGDGDGLLHDYIRSAMAEALGLEPEALDDLLGSGMTLLDIIEAQGLTVEEFETLFDAALAAALADAVAAGIISQTQADHFLAMGLPFFQGEGAPGMAMWGYSESGPHGFGSPELKGAGTPFGPLGPQVGLLEDFLGLTRAEIQTRFRNGETIAGMVAGQGKTMEDLAAFAAERQITAVQDALENGQITQAQADAMLAKIQAMLDAGWTGPFGPFGMWGVPGEGGPEFGEPGQYGPGDQSGPYGEPGEGGPAWGEPGTNGPGGHHSKP